MKRADMIDLFENLVKIECLLESNRTHHAQGQVSENSFAAKLYAEDALRAVRKELKK